MLARSLHQLLTMQVIANRKLDKVKRVLLAAAALGMFASAPACVGAEEPREDTVEQSVARRRNGPYGLWGEQTNYYLFAYQDPKYRNTRARCWYQNEVADGASGYGGLSVARRHFRAMSRAKRIVSYPLHDEYLHEHLQFWGAANIVFGALDVMTGPAICTEAALGALVTPVLPAMIFPTMGAAVLCGLSMWGVSQLGEGVNGFAADAKLALGTNLVSSGTSFEDFSTLDVLKEAVKEKRSDQRKQYHAGNASWDSCPDAGIVMKPYISAFPP
jgi:hypothetical protein